MGDGCPFPKNSGVSARRSTPGGTPVGSLADISRRAAAECLFNKRAEHGSFAATDTMHFRLSVQAPFDEYLAAKTARPGHSSGPRADELPLAIVRRRSVRIAE
jgi:hypothetical protein